LRQRRLWKKIISHLWGGDEGEWVYLWEEKRTPTKNAPFVVKQGIGSGRHFKRDGTQKRVTRTKRGTESLS